MRGECSTTRVWFARAALVEGRTRRLDGVADGTRTHDNQNHNLGLYQLSYSHRRGP